MTIDWHARLLELARIEAAAKAENAQFEDEIDQLTRAFIEPLAARIQSNNVLLDTLRDSLKADFLAHVAETGETHVHDKLTFVRRTRLMYDKEAMLQAAKDHGALNLVRTKQELDVREFEAHYTKGHLPWAEVEEVPAPTAALAKLGDLLIESEFEEAST